MLTDITNEEIKTYDNLFKTIQDHDLIQSLKQQPTNYFKIIEKKWDIEYQIHQLGFSNEINQLKRAIENQIDPKKITLPHVKTLSNRYNINFHPKPDTNSVKRYIHQRYITGELLKNWTDFKSLSVIKEKYTEHLNNPANSEEDLLIIKNFSDYFNTFIKKISQFT